MERQASWIQLPPDNRITSCRFFWHCADFLHYIRQGLHIICEDELALPVDWNDVQYLSQIWDFELKRDAYLLRRLAWSCLHAQSKSRSPRDPEEVLPIALMNLALIGDGSDQVRGLINSRMVLDVYESRMLGWQRPIFSAVLFDGTLEKLQRELLPMEGSVCRREVLCRPQRSVCRLPISTLLDVASQRMLEEIEWRMTRRCMDLHQGWLPMFQRWQRVDSPVEVELEESDEDCLDKTATLRQLQWAEGTESSE